MAVGSWTQWLKSTDPGPGLSGDTAQVLLSRLSLGFSFLLCKYGHHNSDFPSGYRSCALQALGPMHGKASVCVIRGTGSIHEQIIWTLECEMNVRSLGVPGEVWPQQVITVTAALGRISLWFRSAGAISYSPQRLQENIIQCIASFLISEAQTDITC